MSHHHSRPLPFLVTKGSGPCAGGCGRAVCVPHYEHSCNLAATLRWTEPNFCHITNLPNLAERPYGREKANDRAIEGRNVGSLRESRSIFGKCDASLGRRSVSGDSCRNYDGGIRAGSEDVDSRPSAPSWWTAPITRIRDLPDTISLSDLIDLVEADIAGRVS